MTARSLLLIVGVAGVLLIAKPVLGEVKLDAEFGRLLSDLTIIYDERVYRPGDDDYFVRIVDVYDYDSPDIRCQLERCEARRLLVLIGRTDEATDIRVLPSPYALSWAYVRIRSRKVLNGELVLNITAEATTLAGTEVRDMTFKASIP
jgi:hypothetical protein